MGNYDYNGIEIKERDVITLIRIFEVFARADYLFNSTNSGEEEPSFKLMRSYLENEFENCDFAELTDDEISNIAYYADNSLYDFDDEQSVLSLLNEINIKTIIRYLLYWISLIDDSLFEDEYDGEYIQETIEGNLTGKYHWIEYRCKSLSKQIKISRSLCKKLYTISRKEAAKRICQ